MSSVVSKKWEWGSAAGEQEPEVVSPEGHLEELKDLGFYGPQRIVKVVCAGEMVTITRVDSDNSTLTVQSVTESEFKLKYPTAALVVECEERVCALAKDKRECAEASECKLSELWAAKYAYKEMCAKSDMIDREYRSAMTAFQTAVNDAKEKSECL